MVGLGVPIFRVFTVCSIFSFTFFSFFFSSQCIFPEHLLVLVSIHSIIHEALMFFLLLESLNFLYLHLIWGEASGFITDLS